MTLAADDLAALRFPHAATALDGRRATRLICTHFHPDHMGRAG
jgi:glyoxylase-like metal-dependent hydrolase (beta-lactamase superfamily II)